MTIPNVYKGIGIVALALLMSVVGFFTFTFGGLNGYVWFMVLGGIIEAFALFILVQGVRTMLRPEGNGGKR